MTPHHFGIYSGISTTGGHLVAIPEASPVAEGVDIISQVREKSISRFGDDIEYPCDLIMTDCSLVSDLIDLDCYLLLLASREAVVDKNTKYWDPAFDLTRWRFLGWTISDYSGGNYAFCDGFFPVHGVEIDCSDQYSLEVVDKTSINIWGLIKDEASLEMYMQKNNKSRVRYFNDGHFSEDAEIDWAAYGVFCDEYTFSKILK